jgi:hypothetical protein
MYKERNWIEKREWNAINVKSDSLKQIKIGHLFQKGGTIIIFFQSWPHNYL